LTVGNPALFAAAAVPAIEARIASEGSVAADLATVPAPVVAGLTTEPGDSATSPSPAVIAAPLLRLKPVLRSPALVVPASAGSLSRFRPNLALRAAAAVLAQQDSSASNRDKPAAFRAVDAFFADYVRE
jgi:hypothetical protein